MNVAAAPERAHEPNAGLTTTVWGSQASFCALHSARALVPAVCPRAALASKRAATKTRRTTRANRARRARRATQREQAG